jgi:hypothetical protein
MPIRITPPFPLRSQGKTQQQYSTEVEASLSALPDTIADINAVGSAYALATNATSASSVLIGTGAKTFTTQLSLGYQVGQTLRVAANSTNFMTGEVTSYNAGTGSLVLNITSVTGSGTFTSWFISQAAVGANTASSVSFSAVGNISSTNVQSAIAELDTEKLSSAAGAVTGANLENITTAETVGSSFVIPVVTKDENGRVTAITTSQKIISGTVINITSGTSHDHLSIPSSAKKITVMFGSIGTGGSSNYLLQLGDSGGIENTGYAEASASDYNGAINSTAGFILTRTISNTNIMSGILTLVNMTSNTWLCLGNISFTDGTFGAEVVSVAGKKTLSGTLDRIRLTTVNGTDVFDAGEFNILVE